MAWGENGKGRDGMGRKWKRARWHWEKMENGEIAWGENGRKGEMAWGENGKGRDGKERKWKGTKLYSPLSWGRTSMGGEMGKDKTGPHRTKPLRMAGVTVHDHELKESGCIHKSS